MQTQITESQIEMDHGCLEAVLAGHKALNISHAGGELKDIRNHLYNGITHFEIAPEQNLPYVACITITVWLIIYY